MDRARLDAWLARAISGLLIAILVTAPLAMGSLRDQEFFWLQMLGVLAGLLWLWRLWLTPAQKIFLPPIVWPLAAFCIYAIIRCFTADLEYLARKELVRVLFYFLFFFLVLNHFRNARVADLAVGILLVLGMALSVYALRQYLTGTNAIWHYVRPGYGFRGSGTFIYPNHFAGFAEMLLALGLGYVFLGTGSKWRRIFLVYCCVWLVLGIYVSLSRAGWIAMLLSLLVLLPVLLRNRQRQVLAFILFFALLVAGLVWELRTGEITARLTGIGAKISTSPLSARQVLWTGAYKVWQTNPLFGAGPAHFDERFRVHRPLGFQFRPGNAHCDYLNVLADWGLVGAALLAAALVLYLVPAARVWVKTVLDPTALNAATTNFFALTCGGLAATVALLAHSLVDYQWYAPGVMVLFISVIAMVVGQTHANRFEYSLRMPLSGVLIAFALFLTYQGVKSVREHHWLDQARRAALFDDRVKVLERAFAIEPTNFDTAYQLGENYRLLSWEGGENYRELANKAIQWFDRAAALNAFDPFPPLRKAMCLDWLKRPNEAEPFIKRALALDPHHEQVHAIAGWHYFQVENFDKARHHFYEASKANWRGNPIAMHYLPLLDARSAQNTNKPTGHTP